MARNGRLHWITAVLSESCPDGQIPDELAWSHPGIVSEHALELMGGALGADDMPLPLRQWHEQLRSLADRLSRGDLLFRLGGGPLERLGKQAEADLTLADAIGRASAPEVYWDLSTPYIRAAGSSLRDLMRGQRIGRLVLHSRLMVATVDALFRRSWGEATSRPHEMSDTAYTESLTCLHTSVCVYAELATEHFAAHRDPRILADADRRLAFLCDVLEANGEVAALVEALKLRAILSASSAVDQLACRTSAMGSILLASSASWASPGEEAGRYFTYAASLGLGLRFEGSEAGLIDIPAQEAEDDARLLARARAHLDRAREVAGGKPPGDVLGLMLHITARQDVTQPDAKVIAELARKVLDAAGPVSAMSLFLAMRLGHCNPPRCIAALREFIAATPAAMARREGLRAGQWAVLEAVELAWQVAPELAGPILDMASDIFPDHGPRRIILTRLHAEYLVRGDRLLADACRKGARGDLAATVATIQELAVRSPALVSQHPYAIQFLLLTVAPSAGLEADLRGHAADGLNAWLYALTLACDLRYWNIAYPLLLDARRKVAQSRGEAGPRVVRTLAGCAAVLECHVGDQATTVLQAIYRQTLAHASQEGVQASDLLLTLDLAKGHRFSGAASWWASGGQQEITSAIPPELSHVRSPDLDGLSEDELWLRDLRQSTSVHLPYREDLDLSRWESQVYELPKRRLDAQVYAAAFASGANDPPPDLTGLPDLLPPRELVLDLYLGFRKQDEYALFVHACSKEGWTATTQPIPAAILRPIDEDEVAFARPLSAEDIDLINKLAGSNRDREDVVVKAGDQVPLPYAEFLTDTVYSGVLSPSGPGEAIAELRHLLESATAELLGPALDIVRQHLRQGGDRVTFIPHGPLRTFPFHLLILDGQPLAQRCCLTYATTLRSLTIPAGQADRRGIAVFSYAVGDPAAGFPALPDVASEAAEIAAMFGARVHQEQAATATAFLDALGESRYVHIATHGGIDEVPSFHYLVTAPDAAEANRGRLYAFQILDRDLRGVELVTLSACTTSLVRFDDADNPRGIVANLLLKGARFVVGALWEVRTEVARDFFVGLYRGIRAGLTVPEAFWAAQQATRERYPALRDWGAFAVLGSRSAVPLTAQAATR